MSEWLEIPWEKILIPEQPVEMIVRGTLTYLGLLIILRVVLKRQSGNLAFSDLLVTVLIADAIQHGMAGEYHSVPDGLMLVGTIVAWDYVVDWLAFRFKPFNRFLTSPPLPLVKKGRLVRANLRREFISEDELWSKLRQEGVDSLSKVKEAFLEDDGEISVIKAKSA
jgi:uncharacterized membrane protein YcaP (DUF421 family)